MTFTPEQLRQFAEAGGWQYQAYVSTDLPDFPNDLKACFEVLERVCKDYDLRLRNGVVFVCTIYKPSDEWAETGTTKQEAIIKAVLQCR